MIFMDPPYRMDLEKQVLIYLKDSISADSRFNRGFSGYGFFLVGTGIPDLKIKEYKTNKHLFIEKYMAADRKEGDEKA